MLLLSFAEEVLLPLYFANSGIRTNIGTLDTGRYWGITLAIILIATCAKFVPACLVTKWISGRSWRFSATIGVLMNTRGLVELIALNIGLSLVSEWQGTVWWVKAWDTRGGQPQYM
jgi:Kef-type K+ transport system membrane component KefB